jgi:hypothetical protein
MAIQYFPLSKLYAIVGPTRAGNVSVVQVPGFPLAFETRSEAEKALAST